MKRLLIIGAGGHGKVVAEVAEDIEYEKIAFLDDNAQEAIGKVSKLENFKVQYCDSFVGSRNNSSGSDTSECLYQQKGKDRHRYCY